MFNKVNDKDREYNSNNTMRPLFIVIFMASLALISIFYGCVSGGFGISYRGLKPASERRKPKPSNITSNVPITSNIIESNSNSNEVIEPTSNKTSNRQVEPTSNKTSNRQVEPTSNEQASNPTSNEVVVPTSNVTSNAVIPEKGEATYKIVHKYEQLDGTYLDEEITDKGTIDSEVTPEVNGKDGYENPTIQKVKIKEDGTTVIEYVYNLEKYTLTVNNYEFIEEGNVSGEYKYGSTVTLTAKEREHHEFTEWTNGETSQKITLTIKGNTEIGLIYDQTAYVVKYNGNGAPVDPETIVVNKGDGVGTLPTPDYVNVKTHTLWGVRDSIFNDLDRTFIGWYTELIGGIKVEDDYIPNSDITLYARYDDPCKGLANESWKKIAENVEEQSDYYPLGCTKDIELDTDQDGTNDKTVSLVVINNTTPEECNSKNFSQAACGFVMEFETVEFSHKYDSSLGVFGWEDSELRTYLNDDIYNLLPKDMKDYINPTRLVYDKVTRSSSNSGGVYFSFDYDFYADEKEEILDKLYIAGYEEKNLTTSYSNTNTVANTQTRTFDYYNLEISNIQDKKCQECTQTTLYWSNTMIYREGYQMTETYLFGYDYYTSSPTRNYGVVPILKIGVPKVVVSFNTNDGLKINQSVIKSGDSIGTLPNGEKSGYIFEGWYTELNGGIRVDENYIPNSDVTLYARYTNTCNGFETDSWDTISANIKNKIDYYPVGCTKKITLAESSDKFANKEYTLRILNNTYGEECDNPEYSETACGFVLGFDEIVFKTVLKNDRSDSSLYRGWLDSNIRLYLNDYLYNALPFDLSKNIIDTRVYSGYKEQTKDNYVTTDKFYIPSVYNIFGQKLRFDSLKDVESNQLDYYRIKNLDYKKRSPELIKEFNGEKYRWILMSMINKSSYDEFQYIVRENGGLSAGISATYQGNFMFLQGVSPMFRLDTSNDEKETYSIYFNSQGHTINNTIKKITKGNSIGTLEEPEVLNGEFVGWYTELNGGIRIDSNFVPTSDITLYARYNDPCNNFEGTLWSTISDNVKNQVDYYPIGCRKQINIDELTNENDGDWELSILYDSGDHAPIYDGLADNKYVVRVSNNSNPEQCSSEGYSKTACGFVLEFENIIAESDMANKSEVNWDESKVRSYLKDFYEILPPDLKKVIILTDVISSDYSRSDENITTIDKLYLSSPLELWGDTRYEGVDSRYTRQLDYYKNKNTTLTTNTDALVKEYNDEAIYWWTRSITNTTVSHYSTKRYMAVNYNGQLELDDASYSHLGISPVFRIGQSDGYEIKYDINGGVEKIENDLVHFGDTIKLPEPISALGKKFVGWYTGLTDGIKITEGYIPTSDMTLYARYENGCSDFETASWSTIKTNIENDPSYYSVGCEKTISLDLDNDGTVENDFIVRVTNNTSNSACSEKKYSQTSCGVVFEFKDVITEISMNSTVTNVGGWESAELREYLNTTIYNAFPSDLKDLISPTFVTTGRPSSESNKDSYTADRLFLLSEAEVYGRNTSGNNETTFTRKLDYYHKIGTTYNKIEYYYKKYNNQNSMWWMRTPYRFDGEFVISTATGSNAYNNATSKIGIAPAFKLGNPKYVVKYDAQNNEIPEIKMIDVEDNIGTLPKPKAPLLMKFVGWYTQLEGGEAVDANYKPSGDITLYARYVNACEVFENDSWSTIKTNVDRQVDYYPVGCTKDVDLDFDSDGETDLTTQVRVSNNSNPASCTSSSYSKTACGFVLEFVDNLTQVYMNSSSTNVGGWSASYMREFINNDVYNALPSELKEVIMPTRVISGYGENDTANFKTVDKLYLLSSVEVFGEPYHDTVDTSMTRQLDYYNLKNVTINQCSNAVKNYYGSSRIWWLRSAFNESEYTFGSVSSSGRADYESATANYFVSPAFRVGTSNTTYYTIQFDTNTGNTLNPIILEEGEIIDSLPTFKVPMGKEFVGWYTQLDGGEKIEEGYKPNASMTLYARYNDLCNGFENASWSTIKSNIDTKLDYYGVGCSKMVDLDFNHDGTTDKSTRVRIANNTQLEECSNENYSQSACGLVFEFEDIIDMKEMGGTTAGGWPSTTVRQYLNADLYDALPSDLKEIIIPTRVLSGNNGDSYYKTIDNLYLPSVQELLNYSEPNIDMITTDYTKQLDYYKVAGVDYNTDSYDGLFKKYGSDYESWWLRTIYRTYYLIVESNSPLYFSSSSVSNGVSPLFRIGTSTDNYIIVKFNSNGGSTIGNEYYLEGENIDNLPVPTPPEGYEFDGWYTQLEGGEKVEVGYTPSGEITLYARYIDICNDFGTTDWTTISTNVNNQLDYYGIGCKKSVELDFNQDGETDKTVKVRVANNTEPEECSQEGFSQSACGFVIEFDEIIDNKEMNEENTTVGGYPGSTLKTYIDSTIYNSLPSELKNVIIDTPSIYGHGNSDSENFESVNKLYLLSFNDLFDDIEIDSLGDSQTRQLDYYYSKGLNTSDQGSWNIPKKKLNGTISNWWLATPYNSYFVFIPADSPIDYDSAYYEYGISPAFRLAGTKRSFD